jgi:hypothetical protein
MNPRSQTIPRVYDEFDDGDTRLNPAALVGSLGPLGPLGPLPARVQSGTVLMPAAPAAPAPIAPAIAPPIAPVIAARAVHAAHAPARRPLDRAGRGPTVIEVCVGAIAVVLAAVVIAVVLVSVL